MGAHRLQAYARVLTRRNVGIVAGSRSTNAAVFERLGSCVFNPDGYTDNTTFTLVVACEVDNSQTYEIQLYDVTAGAYVAGTITDSNTSNEAKELTLDLATGQRVYELHARLTTGSGGSDYLYVTHASISVQS